MIHIYKRLAATGEFRPINTVARTSLQFLFNGDLLWRR